MSLAIAGLLLVAISATTSAAKKDITLENQFIKVVISPETLYFPALRIREFYNKLQDETLNLVYDDRWLELEAALSTDQGGSTITAYPASARVSRQKTDSVTLTSPRFIQVNGDRPFPLQTKVTFQLQNNKLLVFYTLTAKAPVALGSPIRLISFFSNRTLPTGAAYSWTRDKADIPVQTFKRQDKPKFTSDYRPANHVRLQGSGNSIDIYSPDGGMDQLNVTKENRKWIVFSELIPNGQTSTGVSLRQDLTTGETITRAITIVAGYGTEPLRAIADPTAMFSPFPDGASNVIVQVVDDLPSVTVDSAYHWNVPNGPNDANAPFAAQMISLLNDFPAMKLDLQVIWDSMIGVTQAEADQRVAGTEQVAPDAGAGSEELWKFHNPLKRVALAPGAYHAWMQDLQKRTDGYFAQVELGNGSYHYRRLDKVSLYEWENDPAKTVPAITTAYAAGVFAQIKADALASGLTMPTLFRAPADKFNQVLLDPAQQAGTEAFVLGSRQRMPHLLHTTQGDMVALYWNWDPSWGSAEEIVLGLLKRGWPVIGVGTYFDGTAERLAFLKHVFQLIGEQFPRVEFLFAGEYAQFIMERKQIVWMGESYDDASSTLTVTFSGSAIHGQTLLVAPPTYISKIVFPPTVDGKTIKNYTLLRDRLVIVLPKLTDAGEHTVTVRF